MSGACPRVAWCTVQSERLISVLALVLPPSLVRSQPCALCTFNVVKCLCEFPSREACFWHHVCWDASEFPSQPRLCRSWALADFLWLHTRGSLPWADISVPAVSVSPVVRSRSHGSHMRRVVFLPELGQQNRSISGCSICHLGERPSEVVGFTRAGIAWPIRWGRSWFW